MKSRSALAGILPFLVLFAAPAGADSSEQEGKAELVRPDGAPDADAKGKVKLKHDGKDGKDEFKVKAEHLDASLTFEVFLETSVGSGSFQSIGTMLLDDDDEGSGGQDAEFQLRFRSKDGPLPLNAASVLDLVGLAIQVQSGGQVYLVGVVPDVSAGSAEHLDGKAPLVRPDGAPDADAKGSIKVEQEDGGDEFKVKAEHLDASLTFEVFLETSVGSDSFQSIGTMLLDDDEGSGGQDAEFRLKFKSEDGALPLGVSSVADLVGLGVQVQSGGQVYLEGEVPALSAKQKHEGKWSKAKDALVRPSPAPVTEAKGKVEVSTRLSDGAQRLKVRVEGMPQASYHVFLEDAVGSGQFVDAGAMAFDASEGDEYEARWDTSKGDQLPAGVQSVADLAGRRIEVRDASDQVVLFGVVPDVTAPKSEEKTKKAKDKFQEGDVKGKIKVKSQPKKGSQELKIEVEHLQGVTGVDIYVDDGSGTLQFVAHRPVDGDEVRYKVKTKNGDALPFGETDVAALAGRAVEIRDEADGSVLLHMTIPSF